MIENNRITGMVMVSRTRNVTFNPKKDKIMSKKVSQNQNDSIPYYRNDFSYLRICMFKQLMYLKC